MFRAQQDGAFDTLHKTGLDTTSPPGPSWPCAIGLTDLLVPAMLLAGREQALRAEVPEALLVQDLPTASDSEVELHVKRSRKASDTLRVDEALISAQAVCLRLSTGSSAFHDAGQAARRWPRPGSRA